MECTCFLLDVKYHTTHYGATDPATTHEPNPDCPVHFPKKQVEGLKSPYEELQKARRKLAKWQRKADKAGVGAEYQKATIKVRWWEEQVEIWFERWQLE